eukprot:gnl/Chilomastix_cuspidata/3541.p1 GENE.gnl/Chilomastix_cuspidata/3541~~gnl/Chilomastix_cuspidata/3541.p1  ORF type:complete len:348 (-),score=119.77 gnl/Chilomastix_cuspidata/3541:7-1050(-)
MQNAFTSIQVQHVVNDGSEENTLRLIPLKELFSVGLPRMPKDYVTRVVFDPSHSTFALYEDDILLSAICFRAFFDRQFVEIVFCVVQKHLKGRRLGGRMMNLFKEYVKEKDGTTIITYADNTAIDFFAKQGFSCRLTRPIWDYEGRIKHYDHALLMECPLSRLVDFRTLEQFTKRRRQLLLEVVQAVPHAPPPVAERSPERLRELIATHRDRVQGIVQISPDEEIAAVLSAARYAMAVAASHPQHRQFMDPVRIEEHPEYLSYVKQPMDLQIIADRIDSRFYRTAQMFLCDVDLIHTNCVAYNCDDHAVTLQARTFCKDVKAAFQWALAGARRGHVDPRAAFYGATK